MAGIHIQLDLSFIESHFQDPVWKIIILLEIRGWNFNPISSEDQEKISFVSKCKWEWTDMNRI